MYYTIIIGNGSSSRVNIESLLDDYFYAKDDKGVLVIPVTEAPSQGQIFAAQFAKDNGIELLVIATEDANLSSIPAASLVEDADPIRKAFTAIPEDVKLINAFFLWEDNDPNCANALAWAKDRGISACDLTNGLVDIIPAEGLVVSTPLVIPEEERGTVEGYEEEDEEYEESDVDELLISDAVVTLLRLFAREVAKELKKLNEE
jgi:hypothetical protein